MDADAAFSVELARAIAASLRDQEKSAASVAVDSAIATRKTSKSTADESESEVCCLYGSRDWLVCSLLRLCAPQNSRTRPVKMV